MTRLPGFRLETYFSRWEFTARHHLTASDVQTMTLTELLGLADDKDREAFENLSPTTRPARSSTPPTSAHWPACATSAASTCSATRSTAAWNATRPAPCRTPPICPSAHCR